MMPLVSLFLFANIQIYFFLSIWAGRMPKSSNLAGPAFYDTAHGPDFFPLNAVPKFRS